MPGLWTPFCRAHHSLFHRSCEQAGVDFRKQRNLVLGYLQSIKALLVGLWMVIELMEKHVNEEEEQK